MCFFNLPVTVIVCDYLFFEELENAIFYVFLKFFVAFAFVIDPDSVLFYSIMFLISRFNN